MEGERTAMALGTTEEHRDDFHRELREATRSTAIPSGVLILVAFLAWLALDRALEPTNADRFLVARLVADAAITVPLALIVLRRVRGAALEWATFAMFAIVQVAIAWMLPRVEQSYEAYLLGFSLPLYGSAVLVTWRWQLTAVLSAVSVVALTVFSLLEPSSLSARTGTIAGFYVGTAVLVAVIAQHLRHQAAWREFETRRALEAEQQHTDLLVTELARLSREDVLTGLANRRGWQEQLDGAFTRCRHQGGGLAVVLCDLDHFKRINDTHGHATGDEVLRRVGAMLVATARLTDTVARLGGDEFGIVCPRADEETAAMVAVRLVEGVRALELDDLGVGPLSCSVGAATMGGRDPDTDALVHRADAQMYRAKETRDAAWVAGLRRDAVSLGATPPAG